AKFIIGIPHSPTGQAVIEHTHQVSKSYLLKQKGDEKDPHQRLNKVLFTINFLCLTEGREEPPAVIHQWAVKSGRPQSLPGLPVTYGNP
ncbi:POK19 protein, partial [Rhadina sibilatrix]|nr:POK19 protein [Rhadina sibilatrix]NXR68517.1 POK19 protein [Rhadina sibilatrix]